MSSAATPAHAAKAKKCKKSKKSADAAKKKRCKKSKDTATDPVVPVQPGAPPPTIRATLTWNTESDLDLYVWDAAGRGGYGAAAIPDSLFSGDDPDFGPERFSDQLSPSNRQFTFGVCAFDVLAPTDFTLALRYADGTTNTLTQADYGGSLTGDGEWVLAPDSASFDPGPGDHPTTGWCDA